MKSGKETRFQLTSIINRQAQMTQEYIALKRQIDDNGSFIAKSETDTVKIYTPELALFLFSKDLPALNLDTKTETTITGWDYLKTYIEAYKEGEQYFENEFKISPNTLYGANAGQYVSDIHSNFFHIWHTNGIEGWSYVKRNYLITISHQAVKEYGYYSGIVSKVEELIEKYHRLFVEFDKCEYGLCEQPKNQPPVYNGEETWLINAMDKISNSYKAFNSELFEAMQYQEYLGCFNLNNQNPTHPKFKKDKGVNFIYFLSQIEDRKVTPKIALECFGLKGYKTRKPKAKPDAVFVNRVRALLKIS